MKIKRHVYPFIVVIFSKDMIELFFYVAIILLFFFKKSLIVIDLNYALSHKDVICLNIVYSSTRFFLIALVWNICFVMSKGRASW